MNWKHWLSLALSTFGGGAAAWAGQHFVVADLSSAQAFKGFAVGAVIAGVVALCNLLQPSPQQSKSNASKRGFVHLGALLFAAAVSGLVLLILSLTSCTQQQAQNGVNAVFTAEQVACLAANTGFLGDSNAVQEFEGACKISPQLEGDLQAFIAALGKIAASPHAGCIGGAK